MSSPEEPHKVQPLDPAAEAARLRTRRRRSIALGAALALFAVIFYVLTVIKMGPGILDRAL
ncbi:MULTISPECIES: hypothetical protein [unclassified Devosia]|uniref:hypothetical protein n=1 Tax=unclassified Devosia TaxID=196773 RepID=UPI000FD9611D|nr:MULTISPECIES: hypothetical protein [unclassified Devosia]